jgi:shikimate kinase
MNNQIIIIGFMGAGKTTVARELARKLDCQMVDLDELLTSGEGRSPREIIEQDGEDSFREIEAKVLRGVLSEKAARVVAVGGGAWTIDGNRKAIAEHGAFTVWLDAPFELCWSRIEAGLQERPLAGSQEQAARLYHERHSSYELARARISVAASDSAEEIAMRVIHELSQQNVSSPESQSQDD